MNDQLRAFLNKQADELAENVRQALEMANGDAMAAVRALVIANNFLHEENERLRAQVSSGFTRGQARKPSAAKR